MAPISKDVKNKFIRSIIEIVIGVAVMVWLIASLIAGKQIGMLMLLILPALLLVAFGIWGVMGYFEKKRAPVVKEDDDIKFNF